VNINQINIKWVAMTAAGAILGAIVVYQLKKHTKGLVSD